jgi:CHAT domain-containing protein
VLAGICRERASARGGAEHRFVALAEEGLEAAVPEVEGIASLFSPDQCWASGRDADAGFLRRHGPRATHLHFACHAGAGTWGEGETGVLLGDGTFLTAAELTELGELEARVVSVSACQSAVVDLGNLPEESFSIGGVMLAAGAACSIASLWPVRDDTAALLMTRFYEEMIGNRLRPPEALRRAQLWLRDLDEDGLEGYLNQHLQLRAEFRRRAERRGTDALRSEHVGASDPRRPFSGAECWAPFIASGA